MREATLCLLEGRFDNAEAHGNEMLRHAGSDPNLLNSYGGQQFTLNRERGRLSKVRDGLERAASRYPRLVIIRAMLALADCELGELENARRQFEGLASSNFSEVPRDSMWTASVAYLAEVAGVLEDKARASTLYDLFAPHRGHLVVLSWGVACLGAVDRFVGMLSAVLGRWETAEAHFDSALALEARVGAPPLAARTRYWFARMLLARGEPIDRGHADQLLAASLLRAEDLGMSRLAEQARALRSQRKG
jgi:tetratricopeptide (TPR) repeat protein